MKNEFCRVSLPIVEKTKTKEDGLTMCKTLPGESSKGNLRYNRCRKLCRRQRQVWGLWRWLTWWFSFFRVSWTFSFDMICESEIGLFERPSQSDFALGFSFCFTGGREISFFWNVTARPRLPVAETWADTRTSERRNRTLTFSGLVILPLHFSAFTLYM